MGEKIKISGPVYYGGTVYRVSSTGEMIEPDTISSLIKIDEIDGDKNVWLYVSNKYIQYEKENKNMKTNEFSATIGIISGYQGSDCLKQFSKMDKLELAKVWQQKALEEFNANGIYVSAIINYSHSLYNTDWGCPIGGEPTFTLEGSRNPQFCLDEDKWKESVRNVVKAVKKHFNQSTITLNFREIEQEYITD